MWSTIWTASARPCARDKTGQTKGRIATRFALFFFGATKMTPTLLINAGGASRRMGQPKALLPAPGSGEPLIRYIAIRLLPLVDDLLVIANDPALAQAVAPLRACCLADAYPGAGPLGGLATGLATIEDWCLCVACDLPFVQPAVFHFLLAQADDDWDAVVPHVAGRPQPLHALYHRRCLPAIETALGAGQRRMDSFLPQVRTRRVTEEEVRPFDPDLRSFVNINTWSDWTALGGSE